MRLTVSQAVCLLGMVRTFAGASLNGLRASTRHVTKCRTATEPNRPGAADLVVEDVINLGGGQKRYQPTTRS